MANTDPKALEDAALAYQRSNASLKDYDPSKQEAIDFQWAIVEGDENTHPQEPITATADAGVAGLAADAKPSTTK